MFIILKITQEKRYSTELLALYYYKSTTPFILILINETLKQLDLFLAQIHLFKKIIFYTHN
ncbi:hypothetical protein C7U71_27395, partial [Escherichia coli]